MNLSTDIFEKSVLRISVYFQKVLKNLLNKKCRKIPYLSDFAASTLYIEYDIIFPLSDVLLSIQAL